MKRATFWAKALFFVIILPATMTKLSRILEPLLPEFTSAGLATLAGTVLVPLGAYVMIRGYLILSFLGKRWPAGPTVRLVDRYIYRFVLHPVYWGYTVLLIGIGLRRESLAFVAQAVLVGVAFLAYVTFVEDRELRRRFGRKYEEYRRQVPMILPLWKALYYDRMELNWVLLLVMGFMQVLLKFIWRVRVEGQEYLPEDGKCVVMCNHVNLLDPFLVGLYSTRIIHFMASDELFRSPITRLFFRLMGAFPKRRWSRDISALRTVRRYLEAGEMVGIFPEGARNWDGGPVAVGDEVYKFLHRCNAPIVCASLIGGHEVWPRWSTFPAISDLTVRFFPRLNPDDFSTYHDLRAAIEERIFSFVAEPPRPRRALAGHHGITTVAWGCVKCGGVRTLEETREGLVCRKCGAAWGISRALEFVDKETGEVTLERDYHLQLRRRLERGAMDGGLNASTTATAFRIESTERLTRLGRGELTLSEKEIRFSAGAVTTTRKTEDIYFCYLNLADHLVVVDANGATQFALEHDSPVKWEDYVEASRGNTAKQWTSRHAKGAVMA
ncbi:MAG: 1-acyl-sn-glycerol-3-phosphate acyltransferase [Firmicutes bacterium]|jgi:1-acyl-sn-glycerol-3-phosphate acyltransferase|nr:1-acyl-sn-glycerol-3-phosphate acyltransferase [Bacillota bacterium]